MRGLRPEIFHGAFCVEVPFILFSSSPVVRSAGDMRAR
nr:MAG TPA: hypothetical protein [Caudoviricetes sp.]